MSRLNHRRRSLRLPKSIRQLGIGPFKKGILWAELRAREQEQVINACQERLDARDPVDQRELNRGNP
jgi:hypothetical protein